MEMKQNRLAKFLLHIVCYGTKQNEQNCCATFNQKFVTTWLFHVL